MISNLKKKLLMQQISTKSGQQLKIGNLKDVNLVAQYELKQASKQPIPVINHPKMTSRPRLVYMKQGREIFFLTNQQHALQTINQAVQMANHTMPSTMPSQYSKTFLLLSGDN